MWVLAVVGVFFLGACKAENVLILDQWQLHLPHQPSQTIDLPAHLDNVLPSKQSEYRLTKKVTIPKSWLGKPITFAVPRSATRCQLFVNHQPAIALSPISESAYRHPGSQAWRLPPSLSQQREVELEWRIEHTWTQSGWLDTPPRLSPTIQGDKHYLFIKKFNEITGFASIVTITVIGFCYLLLSLSRYPSAAAPWFTLEAVTGTSYAAFSLGITQIVFYSYDGALVAIMMSISAVCALHFVYAQFHLGTLKRWWWTPVGLLIVLAPFLGTPFGTTKYLAPITVFSLASVSLVLIYVAFSMWRAGEATARKLCVVLAWPFACFIGASDICAWLGWGELHGGLRIGCTGIALIAFVQAIDLTRDHLGAVESAETLNHELEERIKLLQNRAREVDLLNHELRRQIAFRSADLADAIARLDRDSEDLPTLKPDFVIDQRYQIVRNIAAGAMGAVYEVIRIADSRHLALKVLKAPSDSEALARMAREARLAAKVMHPNVVELYDVDIAQEGFLFLVMELIVGDSLKAHEKRYGQFVWAMRILQQIIDGMVAIHEADVVHRDLKPANILVQDNPKDQETPIVKITDFGVSTKLEPEFGAAALSMIPSEPTDITTKRERKSSLIPSEPPKYSLDETLEDDNNTTLLKPRAPNNSSSSLPQVTLTQPGILIGTPKYMAPELITGSRHAQPSCDIFSFAVVAFELLAGKYPFAVPPIRALLEHQNDPEIPGFKSANALLSPKICHILDRALSFQPEQRPDAKELSAAFRKERKLHHL
jgi:serine/threonine protein kinase